MTLEEITKSSVQSESGHTARRISRRDFIPRLGLDVALLYMAVDVRPLRWLYDPVNKSKKAQLAVIPNIWPYVEDILRTVVRLEDEIYKIEDNLPHALSTFLIGAAVGNELGAIKRVKRVIRLGSLGSMLLNRILDKYSTWQVVKSMQDPRFKGYGFNKFFYEVNPNLSIHPTLTELFKPKMLVSESLGIAVSYFLPSFGYGFGFSAPALYLRNMRIANALEIGYSIGDKVKEKLSQGFGEQQTRDYLKNITIADLNR